jgi:exonuclease III
MLDEFLYKHDKDLTLIQEVTNSKITTIRRYVIHQYGAEGRGTDILAKDSYLLTNIQRIITGRGLSAQFNGIRIINIYTYATSGSDKKRERGILKWRYCTPAYAF